MANKIRLTVGGITYSVISEDSEEYLKELGRELDARLEYLAKKNPCLSTAMVAILAALEGFDNAKKAQPENERLKIEITRLASEAAVAKSEASAAKERLKRITGKNGI